jgi:hypothetical protein
VGGSAFQASLPWEIIPEGRDELFVEEGLPDYGKMSAG